jgi:hypothetical protein
MSQTSIWGLQNDKNRCKFAKVGLALPLPHKMNWTFAMAVRSVPPVRFVDVC